MADKTACQGLFGRIFGHSFQPVFNTFPPSSDGMRVKGSSEGMRVYLEGLTRKEHVHTICSRCGIKIEEAK